MARILSLVQIISNNEECEWGRIGRGRERKGPTFLRHDMT